MGKFYTKGDQPTSRDYHTANLIEDKSYIFDINTKVSTNYNDINAQYLIKLGSYGLFNRLNTLKSIDNLNE